MEEILSCLSGLDRLRVMQLLLGGPMTQAQLGREVARANGIAELNPGSTSRLLQPFFAAGLVRRSSARGRCALVHPEETEQAVTAIVRLALASADDQQRRA